MSFADDVIGISQQTNQNAAKAPMDALNAYHVAATADHARQALDMEKQNQAQNKFQWFQGQIDSLNRMPEGPARKMMVDGLKRQAPQVMPGMDVSGLDLLHKDPTYSQNLGHLLNQMADPTSKPDFTNANELLSQAGPEVVKMAEAAGQQRAMLLAGQAKAQAINNGQGGRVDEMRNQNAVAAGDHIEKDDIIKNSKKNLNSLMKSYSILTKLNGTLTAKDLNLAYNDYINATAPGGAATEGKVDRELPETWAQELNTLSQRIGDTKDLRKDPAGMKLIEELKANMFNVKRDMNSQIVNQFNSIADNYKSNTNPRVQDTINTKRAAYMKAYASGNLEGNAPTSHPNYAPGTVLNIKGTKYKVGADGDSLEEVK
jgi:hypothetical protein